MNESKKIRNFAIIAHVDHGKSTLADRFLELTGVLPPGRHEEQYLDRNPISRERGITIKLAPVRMVYKNTKFEARNSKQILNSNNQNSKHLENLNFKNSNLFRDSDFEIRDLSNSEYILNLIDTPGHVDFSYEVDRTLACVEGVILLVDATQGVQAQTIANTYKAMEKNLVIIPAVNKIDLPNADIKKTKKQIKDFLGIDEAVIYLVSAKTGEGVAELLQAIIEKIPDPSFQFSNDRQISNNRYLKTQALIFDSYYDSHRGVIAFVRIFSGEVKKGLKLRLVGANLEFTAQNIGVFRPELVETDWLSAGEIGYLVTNLKDIHKVRVGETVVEAKNLATTPLPGYKKVKPMVFASIFPTDTADYPHLKKAIEKLYLNDSSLEFSPIYSRAFGAGFRAGFLGLLHADIVRERLEREYGLNLVLTPPQVEYLPAPNNRGLTEPVVKIMIVTPSQYLGAVMRLCQSYRAKFLTMDSKDQVVIYYQMPMSEMITDFYDRLKSLSSGYASLDWQFLGYQPVDADRLVVLLNGEPVEEFSEVVVKERAFDKAGYIVKKLRQLIPRQQYEVKIQAQFKGKIIASERIAPFRKDVTQKLYGGDRTRKDKLLEKQKEGKKKMKMVGRVEIPKEAFMKLFRKN